MAKNNYKGVMHKVLHQSHQRYVKHGGRLRLDIITVTEAAWLFIGLAFGWFAASSGPTWLLLIPGALFAVWFYEWGYAQKHGVQTTHGTKVKNPKL